MTATCGDVATVEDVGSNCDYCGDPLERGETVAVFAGGSRVHHDGCYETSLTDGTQQARQLLARPGGCGSHAAHQRAVARTVDSTGSGE